MTEQQKSKQASQNSNASRLKWQRQAIANGELARIHKETAESAFGQVADLKARVGELSVQLVDCLDKRVTDSKEIETLRAACQQAENEADIWRTKAHDYEDAEVQRRAREMKGARA
jgi:hypothetical protein